MTDRMRSSRQERQRRREVLRGRFRRSGSRDRLTIIPSPSVESVTAGSAVGSITLAGIAYLIFKSEVYGFIG